jgi:hypothetical protein
MVETPVVNHDVAMLELDESCKVEINVEAEIEKPITFPPPLGKLYYIEPINDGPFSWTGETFTENTVQEEVKLEENKPVVAEVQPKIEPKPVEVQKKSADNQNLSDIEKLLESDDFVDSKQKHVADMLKEMRKGQAVVKKE